MACETRKEDCWEWLGCRTAQGYGLRQSKVHNKTVLVHRDYYEAVHNCVLGSKDIIMHTCDNPGCFNPDHLVKGTYSDNLKDAYDKGRFKNQHQKKTHCIRGHLLPLEKSGKQRRCKECRKIYG